MISLLDLNHSLIIRVVLLLAQGKCLLGYNTNSGSSIHLRLRTDDNRAFRPYNELINTLLHGG